MKLVEVEDRHIEQLKKIYERDGFDYPFPDFNEFCDKYVLVDDNDEVITGIAAMPMVELYLFMNKDWGTPGMRMEALKAIHEFMRKKLEQRGFIGAHIFLPPQLAKRFGNRLKRSFGWVYSTWPCFFRRVSNG